MNLIIRMLLVILRARRGPRLTIFDASQIRLRVWPNDLDVQMHMNNGRYLSLMDLGRIDLMVRSGFFAEARRKGWFPVVGTSRIEYRRPLAPLQSFDLRTRLIGWDARWFYIEQQFLAAGKVAASATVKAMMRSSAGLVAPQEALAAIGVSDPSPALSEAVTAAVGG